MGLSRLQSAAEVDINDWDGIVGGQSTANQKMQFNIHDKNKEGFFELTCCMGTGRVSKFTLRYEL